MIFFLFEKPDSKIFIIFHQQNHLHEQVFLTNGDEKKEGNFILGFPEQNYNDNQCSEIAKKVMSLLDAKGFGKNRRWQASIWKY